jgi:predicted PilT family ATPase
MSNGKYGSFMSKIKCSDGTFNEYTIKPLSQNEIAQGWQLVLPKRKKIMVKYETDEGENAERKTTNEFYFKINLAQLPRHLFENIKPVYKNGEFSHYRACDRIYNYVIRPSTVDDEIRELVTFLNKNEDSVTNISNNMKSHYQQCYQRIVDADIYGWVVFLCKRLFE